MSQFDMSVKEFLESPAYLREKEKLQREINSYPLVIDRSVFKKTKEEKDKTLEMKLRNHEERKAHYGPGECNKHLNIPSRQIKMADKKGKNDK